MADVFGDQPINDDVTLDTLVGDGKKYSDANNLAKAYANAESFLEDLKRENAQLRAQKDAKELNLDKPDGNLEQRQPDRASVDTPKPQLNDKDLRMLVSEELQNLNETQRFERNVQSTAERLIAEFGSGTKAQEAVQNKANELGVSPEWLRDAAARSPNAFYATMGLPNESAISPTSRETPVPKNELRLNPNVSSDKRSYAYYQGMKKENKTAYYSASVQAEMQKQARELGDAFYT